MAGSFSASVRNWSEKAKRNADLVVRGTIQDVGETMTRAVDGVTRGGAFKYGYVPVDTGQLIASVVVQIEGAMVGQGDKGSKTPPDYIASLAGFDLGDTVTVGFTAPHARPIEYGWRVRSDEDTDYGGDVDVPGRFMVREAVSQFVTLADANAALFKD